MSKITKLPDDQNLWSEFHHYFTEFVVHDIEKSLQVDIEVGTIILTTIGIECLSGYYAGDETKREYFVKFMQEFMPEYGYLADDIYECIRNGLAHDYVVKENKKNQRKFILTGREGGQHLFHHPLNPNVFYLNRVTYAKDFLKAQHSYFEEAEKNQILWNKAMQRLHNQKGFLTVRPEVQFVTDTSNEVNFGTLSTPNIKSMSTGTYSKENIYDD